MDAPVRAQVAATLATFATFGAFWGAWGASIARLRDQAGVDEGELGIALLCIGAGALPAMLAIGWILDRRGVQVAAHAIAALGISGLLVALTAHSFVSLAASLVVVGMASGASDVAMNALAGRAELASKRPVITRAHGALSGFVLLASLITAGVAALELPVVIPFACVAVSAVMAAALVRRAVAMQPSPGTSTADDVATSATPALTTGLLAVLGVLGALAFATEGAQQSWSAVFARDELDASYGAAALAPALFAAVVSATRLSIGHRASTHPGWLLAAGGILAAAGSAVIAGATGWPVFVVGLVVAAAGSAVLFPTVLVMVSERVEEARRGRATSVVTTVAYLGFLLGPAYVGAWADAYDLRVAMYAVAALALVLALATPAGVRTTRLTGRARP